MKFSKYQHIERFGTEEVEGIECGTCYVFPKIDGTNASVWMDEGKLCAGSRNRELSEERDNANFFKSIKEDLAIIAYLQKHPTHRLFGEWLVPHTLKTYRKDAWNHLYIFDVCVDKEDGGLEYIPYEVYKPLLEEFDIAFLPPIAIVKNGNLESFSKFLDKNTFLIEQGSGVGEGIVIKNYDFYNKYKRQVWAKIVTNEFREKHYTEMGAPLLENKTVEDQIAEDFITSSFVDKEYAKIASEKEGWRSQYIPMLLGKVFYCLVNEEIWNILRRYNNPIINFKRLNIATINQIKVMKPEIFC